MKILILVGAVVLSAAGYAKDINDFNKILIQDVQHDIHTDNDQRLKKQAAPMRGPASVDEVVKDSREDVKFEKSNVRQIGIEKW